MSAPSIYADLYAWAWQEAEYPTTTNAHAMKAQLDTLRAFLAILHRQQRKATA